MAGYIVNVGDVFSELTVISGPIKTPKGKRWKVRCSCDNEFEVTNSSLGAGRITKCRYCANGKTPPVKTGDIYGDLEILEKSERNGRKYFIVKCLRCNETTFEIREDSIKRSKRQSCAPCARTKGEPTKVGDIFGVLTVTAFLGLSGLGKKMWSCVCDCGKTKDYIDNNLRSRAADAECSCKTSLGDPTRVGDVYGNLTVLNIFNNEKRWRKATCKCTCGSVSDRDLISLRNGAAKSCGCLGNTYSRSDFIKLSSKGIATLYTIKCEGNNEKFFKIGITTRTVKKRFSAKELMPYKYKIVKETKGEAGYIWDLERELHKKHSNHSYSPKIKFNGYTECFSEIIDI